MKRRSYSHCRTEHSRAEDIDIVETFALQVKAMIPLAEVIASDRCTPGDRRRLRSLAGEEGVFKLSTLLNRLCSETVFKTFSER